MASLPADRTKLALAQGNQVPNLVLASAKNINAIIEVYDTVDLLNQKVDLNYGTGAIGTNQLATDSVTLAKMADNSVGTAELVAASVTLAKMAAASVGTTQLVDGSVTDAKIAPATITADKFVAGALNNDTQNGLNIVALQAEKVNVKNYGATGDGVTDDTTAVKNALADLLSKGGGVLFFPRGHYKINSALNLSTARLNGITFLGETATLTSFNSATQSAGSIIDLSANTTVLCYTQYQCKFINLSFVGGAGIVDYSSGIDGNYSLMQNCRFLEQTGVIFNQTGAGNGSKITFEHIQQVSTSNTTKLFQCLVTDSLTVIDAWIENKSDVTFDCTNIGTLILSYIRFVPYQNITDSDGGVIAKFSGTNGGTFRASDCDFGGESKRLVLSYSLDNTGNTTKNSGIMINRCGIFGDPTVPYIKMYTTPNFLDIIDCHGNTNSYGLWFDPAMNDANKKDLANIVWQSRGRGELTAIQPLSISGLVESFSVSASRIKQEYSRRDVQVSDIVNAFNLSAQSAQSTTNFTGGAAITDPFGNSTNDVLWTAGAGGGSRYLTLNNITGFSALANGDYTVELWIHVIAKSINVNIFFGNANKIFSLGQGWHRISLPSVFTTNTTRTLNVSITAPAGAQYGIARGYIFNGIHHDRNIDFLGGSVAPTTGSWFIGDKVKNTAPAAAGYGGFICLTQASPGTWKGVDLIQA